MAKSEVEQFISNNHEMQVNVSEGVDYAMRDVIDKAYMLYNARFQTGEVEDNGFERIFMRKMWVVYRTLIQGSDLDMNKLNVRSINGIKVRLTALLKMLFVSHLEREAFGEMIDKIMGQMCWFGSSIVKRYDGTVDIIDFRNYITEANQPDPQLRRHLFLVPYSYDKVASFKDDWEDSQDEIQAVWKEMQKEGVSTFNILEFWTFDEKGEKVCKKYLDNTITKPKHLPSPSEWEAYIKLDSFKTPYKIKRNSKRMAKKLGEWEYRFPFEQFDLFLLPGRTFALGCAELLGGPQEYYNELFTYKRKLDLKALMGITVHNAVEGEEGLSEMTQDFISNLTVGTTMTLAPGEKIEQLKVDTRGFDFSLMEEKIYELMRQIIGVTAQGTGEETPASTSATQANINQKVANTVFDYTRERMHHGIKRLFNKGYAQDIIEELDEQEVTAITGDPTALREFDKMLVDNAVNAWALEYKETMGMYPSEEEYAQIHDGITQQLEKQEDMRFPKFKKSLLKDMEYLFTFEMQQESFDYKLRSDALLAMKNDPLSTKSKEKIEDELLTLQGLNPRQYDKTVEEKEAERMQAEQIISNEQQATMPPAPIT